MICDYYIPLDTMGNHSNALCHQEYMLITRVSIDTPMHMCVSEASNDAESKAKVKEGAT